MFFDMRCLEGVSIMDSIVHEKIRRRCGSKMSLTARAEQKILK